MVKIEVQKYLLDNSFFGPDIIIACGSQSTDPTNEGMENYLQMYQLSSIFFQDMKKQNTGEI